MFGWPIQNVSGHMGFHTLIDHCAQPRQHWTTGLVNFSFSFQIGTRSFIYAVKTAQNK